MSLGVYRHPSITIRTALTPQITLDPPEAKSTLRLAIKDARLEPDPGHCRGCFEPVQQAGRVAEFCLICAPQPGPGPVQRSWTAFKRAGRVTRESFAKALKNTGNAFVMAIAHAVVGMDHALDSERATDVRKRWRARRKKIRQNTAIAGAMGILEQAETRFERDVKTMTDLTKALASGLSTTEAINSLRKRP